MLARLALLLGVASILASAPAVAQTEVQRTQMAPTGHLRVGVYPGSPSSMLRDPKTGETRGVTVELGAQLAAKLGVPVELVVFPRVAEVVEGIKAGTVDFTVTNASPARALEIAFGPTLLTSELGYLAPAGSVVATIADVEKPGVRVGVTKGSTSERTLPRRLPNATITPAASLADLMDLLNRHEVDVYATNKTILFEMSDKMPGSRVLDGRWGEEHFAAAIPKDRAQALDYLRAFCEEARATGAVERAAERAGLRGLAKD